MMTGLYTNTYHYLMIPAYAEYAAQPLTMYELNQSHILMDTFFNLLFALIRAMEISLKGQQHFVSNKKRLEAVGREDRKLLPATPQTTWVLKVLHS